MRPVSDILFMASGNGSFVGDVYKSDQPVSVMGCTEQHQFCNTSRPSTTDCNPLTGLKVNFNYMKIGMNAKQLTAATRLYTATSSKTLISMISDLGSASLLAQKTTLAVCKCSLRPSLAMNGCLKWKIGKLVLNHDGESATSNPFLCVRLRRCRQHLICHLPYCTRRSGHVSHTKGS